MAVNDRWGKETRSKDGGFYSSEYGRYMPDGVTQGLAHKWEESQGMGKSFGYNRMEAATDYRSANELVHLLVDTVNKGGNLLLDVGPTADGRIPVIMQERLLADGRLAQGEWRGDLREPPVATDLRRRCSLH